jgi:FlaA1/EpsC-like NDP-sugar epimerase
LSAGRRNQGLTHRDSAGARTNLLRKDEFNRKTILVTGSSGLVGSEAVEYFDRQGNLVIGTDNNMRHVFFGPAGDTT